MDPKTSEWRPGPTVCRCCLTEGCYKDISTEYFWMGKREVYAEMLSDTFNVSISFSQSGGPNSNSRLICEPCISRLRDASDFKQQVQECEKTFMHHLDPGASSIVDDLVEPQETDVKLEQVKLEKRLSDDEFIDHTDFMDDDDDDLDDQPLTKLATRLPKKESVDLLDLLDNAKPAEKRKSSTKLKATSSKKAKLAKIVKKETVKAATSKVAQKTEKKKKDINPMYFARWNAKMVIQYTTAYPFKLPDAFMMCVYCCENFNDPALFRDHMKVEHEDFKPSTAFAHITEGFIKVDCTELTCRLCNKELDTLEQAAEHLITVHGKNIDLNYDLGMHAFKIGKDKYACAICSEKFSTLPLLSKHTHKHYVKYTCETCGKSYASITSLQCHLRYSCGNLPDMKKCRKCKRIFSTLKERQEHMKSSNKCCQHVCNICGERFVTWNMKQNHLTEKHNKPARTYPCPECSFVFNRRDKLRKHFKIDHTDDHVECPFCGKKFDNDKNLKTHIVIHTGERMFVCNVCSKAFPRRSTLRQHLWIHSDIKKHECKMCDKQFNQKVSWRTHMKSRHPELCNF